MVDESVAREVVTRAEARANGLKRYIGKPCKSGHKPERFVSSGGCCACIKERTSIRQKERPLEAARYRANYAEKHPGATKAYSQKYHADNQDRARERGRAWKKKNPHLVQGGRREYIQRRRQATPRWLTAEDQEQILALYREAARKTKSTSVRHDVDHIVPLKGKTVCGLHVPWNLQVLPSRENSRKSNSHEDVGRTSKSGR